MCESYYVSVILPVFSSCSSDGTPLFFPASGPHIYFKYIYIRYLISEWKCRLYLIVRADVLRSSKTCTVSNRNMHVWDREKV